MLFVFVKPGFAQDNCGVCIITLSVSEGFQFPDESPLPLKHVDHIIYITKMEVRGIFASTTGNLNDSSIEGGDHSVVISVVENRAREICICKIDTLNVIVFVPTLKLLSYLSFFLFPCCTGRVLPWRYLWSPITIRTTRQLGRSRCCVRMR